MTLRTTRRELWIAVAAAWLCFAYVHRIPGLPTLDAFLCGWSMALTCAAVLVTLKSE